MRIFARSACLAVLLGLVELRTSAAIDSTVLAALKTEAASLAAEKPDSLSHLIKHIKASGDIKDFSYPTVDAAMAALPTLGIPDSAVSHFRDMVAVESEVFETFSFKLRKHDAELEEFIGAGRNNNGVVEIAFIDATAEGDPVQQTEHVYNGKCERSMPCYDQGVHNRGFREGELAKIQKGLEAAAYHHVMNKLNGLPDTPDMTLLALEEPAEAKEAVEEAGEAAVAVSFGAVTDPDPQLNNLVGKVNTQVVPGLKAQLLGETESSEIVQHLTHLGFDHFEQSADFSYEHKMADSYIPTFLDEVAERVKVPKMYRSAFKEQFGMVPDLDENTWIVLRLAFSAGKGGRCKYTCIMAKHYPAEGKADWVVADVAADFELAPDLLVVHTTTSAAGGIWGSDGWKVVRMPASIDDATVHTVFDFFEVTIFEKFGQLLALTGPSVGFEAVESGKQMSATSRRLQVPGPLNALTSSINAVTGAWQGIVNAFGSKNSNTIVDHFGGSGLAQYVQNAQMQQSLGLDNAHLGEYLDSLGQLMHVPESWREDWDLQLKSIDWGSNQDTWIANHAVFHEKSGGKMWYAAFLYNQDAAAGKSNIYSMVVDAKFKLDKILLVWRHETSQLGGLFQNTQDTIKKQPRGLSQEDVDEILDLFQIVSFKKFADALGIPATLPQFNPTRRTRYLRAGQA